MYAAVSHSALHDAGPSEVEAIMKQEDEDMDDAGHGGLGLGAASGLGSMADEDEAGPAGLGSLAGLGSQAGLGAAAGMGFARASDSQPAEQVSPIPIIFPNLLPHLRRQTEATSLRDTPSSIRADHLSLTSSISSSTK